MSAVVNGIVSITPRSSASTVILVLLFLLLVLMGVVIARYMNQHKGEYLTQEDKGADICDDPDEAIINSATGHQVTKRKEWFI